MCAPHLLRAIALVATVGNPPDSTNPQKEAALLRLKELLSQGEMAARRGQRGEARRLFREALALDPTNEHAWLWLAYLAPSPRQSMAYLQEARAYHPRSERVRQAMAWAQERLAEAEAAEGAMPTTWREARQPARPPAGRPAPQARPLAQPEAPSRPAPARAMARPQATPAAAPQARATQQPRAPRRRRPSPWLVAGLALLGLGLLVAAVAYGLWAVQRPALPLGPLPTAWPLPTAAVDVGTLRDQANAAIAREDWQGVIPLLERMRAIAPDDEGVRQQLAIAHLRFGLQLVDQDRIDEAIAQYDAAIRLYANDMDLQTARRLAVGYRDGRKAVTEERWDDAIALLEPVYKVAPGFRDVGDLLYEACMRRAQALEEAQQLEAAREAYQQAALVQPDSQEAKAALDRIVAVLTPPTPTPTPPPSKRIEVDISEQRLRAYENDSLVFDWLCSTGIPSMPTRYGDFQILDKIPEAWSSAWSLRMPYWMGIYWAGASENGIHALPILRDGSTLWAGYLGSRVSFGCIVLDTANAATLYDWAEIGTPVKIVP